MFEPYNDEPSTSGLAMWDYDEFEKMVLTADKMGFQIGVHAIGDKGTTGSLMSLRKHSRSTESVTAVIATSIHRH